VTLDCAEVNYATGPIYWESGDQRAAFLLQLIHQGTRLIPCDFIAFARSLKPARSHHDMLLRTYSRRPRRWPLAKRASKSRPRARRTARSPPDLPWQSPSNTNLRRAAHAGDARNAGRALRAQRVHSGVIWNWTRSISGESKIGQGVSQRIVPEIESEDEPALGHDSSTNNMIRR